MKSKYQLLGKLIFYRIPPTVKVNCDFWDKNANSNNFLFSLDNTSLYIMLLELKNTKVLLEIKSADFNISFFHEVSMQQAR